MDIIKFRKGQKFGSWTVLRGGSRVKLINADGDKILRTAKIVDDSQVIEIEQGKFLSAPTC